MKAEYILVPANDAEPPPVVQFQAPIAPGLSPFDEDCSLACAYYVCGIAACWYGIELDTAADILNNGPDALQACLASPEGWTTIVCYVGETLGLRDWPPFLATIH